LKVHLTQIGDKLCPWQVKSIRKLSEDSGFEVAFSIPESETFRCQTQEFEVGQRGAKTAALARFAAASGFGDAQHIFRYLCGLPRDMSGVLFAKGAALDLEDLSAA
jgi:hypothetical protein